MKLSCKMTIKDLTRRFAEKVKNENVNIRDLERDLGIPYDRMYKWSKQMSNPKPPDDRIIENWINGISSNGIIEEKPGTRPAHTEKLISFLEKRLTELEQREAHLKELNNELSGQVKKNLESLSSEMRTNLKNSLDNQLTLTAMLESTIENLAQVLIQEESKQLEFCGKIHREAFRRRLELAKTGTHLEIHNNDITSH